MSEKTETASFRLERNVLGELRKEAESKDISLNSLVSQIFNLHIGWHANAPKAGFVPVPKPFLAKVIEKLSQDEIVNIAEYIAKDEVKNMTMMLGRELEVESILESFEFWLKTTNFAYKHDNDDGTHKFVINHEMGKKWSLYLGEVMRLIFKSLGAQKTEFEISPKTLAFTIANSN
jgi:hypothetical protein